MVYAQIAVEIGVNLQKGQTLVVSTPIECADFAREIASVAYDVGAKDVVMVYNDELFARLRYDKAAVSVFDEFPSWRKNMLDGYARDNAAFITIAANDPEIMKGVNQEKLMRAKKSAGIALLDYRARLMANRNRWCVISRPTISWAKKVFPNLSEKEAFVALDKAIMKATRVDDDNAKTNWINHSQELTLRCDFLNKHNFKCLKYKNSLGTDLIVTLANNHIWCGGFEEAEDKIIFAPNLPTEEVYTMPDREGTDGVVYSSRPLVYQGNLIEDFSLVFKNGKVTEFSAKKNEKLLEELLKTDDGASYLGEVALVPIDSPINKSGILFYNTLFDENASCHLAFGKAYPTCLKGGVDMDSVELVKSGANDSILHEDFMIGTEDLSVVGVTHEGEEIQVMKDGNFAF